jgi:Putative MetA-pathway of phenol degradation
MRWSQVLPALLAATAAPLHAGPPFLTDDPEPTETGHWEIYAPLIEAEGRGAEHEGTAAIELNYGAAPGLQLTLELPLAYAHEASGSRSGVGDLAVSAKYRFFHDEDAEISIAAFPGISLPTASNGLGAGRVTALLPVWAQQDIGPWSVFGGGGYAINPGPGNRDFWTGGIAVSRSFGENLQIGAEADRSGADTVGGSAATSLGLGATYRLGRHLRLLASGGPTFADAGGKAGFHAFAAIGWDY